MLACIGEDVDSTGHEFQLSDGDIERRGFGHDRIDCTQHAHRNPATSMLTDGAGVVTGDGICLRYLWIRGEKRMLGMLLACDRMR